jgi:hypothetical protein
MLRICGENSRQRWGRWWGDWVLSNHFHVVLLVRPDLAQEWSDDEVAIRWRLLFPPHDEATGRQVEPAEHENLVSLSALPSPGHSGRKGPHPFR